MSSMLRKILLAVTVVCALMAVVAGVAAKVGIDAYDHYSSMTLCYDNSPDMVPVVAGGCIGNSNEPGIDVWLSDNADNLVLLSMVGVSGCLSLVAFAITFESKLRHHYRAMIAGIISEFVFASMLYVVFLNHFIGNFLNPGLSSYTFYMTGRIDVGLWMMLSVLLTLLYLCIGYFAYASTKGRRERAVLVLFSLLLLAITLMVGQRCLPA